MQFRVLYSPNPNSTLVFQKWAISTFLSPTKKPSSHLSDFVCPGQGRSQGAGGGGAAPPKSGGSQKYIRGDPCDLGSEAKNRGSPPPEMGAPPPETKFWLRPRSRYMSVRRWVFSLRLPLCSLDFRADAGAEGKQTRNIHVSPGTGVACRG